MRRGAGAALRGRRHGPHRGPALLRRRQQRALLADRRRHAAARRAGELRERGSSVIIDSDERTPRGRSPSRASSPAPTTCSSSRTPRSRRTSFSAGIRCARRSTAMRPLHPGAGETRMRHHDRRRGGNSPGDGDHVTGIVTARQGTYRTDNIYVQDPTGGIRSSGSRRRTFCSATASKSPAAGTVRR